MNIFYLDHRPAIAASYLHDKHIIKMCLETAQILCTVSNKLNVNAPYKSTHIGHPSVLWVGQSMKNWLWLLRHGLMIGNEYTKRFGKIHKSSLVTNWCAQHGGHPPDGDFVFPPQCMPTKYKQKNTISAYRAYYAAEKIKHAKWTAPSIEPYWLSQYWN